MKFITLLLVCILGSIRQLASSSLSFRSFFLCAVYMSTFLLAFLLDIR